ncbi:N-terminal domain of (some) glycogen debranching enzymes [Thermomonospora echinospora]|uniref:N-terminal domain of (Some) glycogen debranching enzymes n=2 Tax=Thermomonospora echinospora TaxID=1992 RepID=A0A1H6BK85_9ACTN|nr:N-terminal domain of (some) glycogen debranching enzymes [Thermomonospora echinospora]
MREDLALRNMSHESAGCPVTLLVDADFADLFEAKEDRDQGLPQRRGGGDGLRIWADGGKETRGVRGTVEHATVGVGR